MFPNFTLSEFISSTKAKELGIDNMPDFEAVHHLEDLCRTILQPLRTAWGSAINVNSGYRCKKLNDATGGSMTSVHPKGYAADLYPANGKFDEFVAFTVRFLQDKRIPFDQLLIESNKKGDRWLHIGLYNNYNQQRKLIKTLQVSTTH